MTELHFELSDSYYSSHPTPEFRETVVNSLPNSLTSLTFGVFEPDISWFRALANSHPQLQRLDAWKSPVRRAVFPMLASAGFPFSLAIDHSWTVHRSLPTHFTQKASMCFFSRFKGASSSSILFNDIQVPGWTLTWSLSLVCMTTLALLLSCRRKKLLRKHKGRTRTQKTALAGCMISKYQWLVLYLLSFTLYVFELFPVARCFHSRLFISFTVDQVLIIWMYCMCEHIQITGIQSFRPKHNLYNKLDLISCITVVVNALVLSVGLQIVFNVGIWNSKKLWCSMIGTQCTKQSLWSTYS